MERIERGPYSFSGTRAADSAKFYDIVMSHDYTGDMTFLAWESAHKFGSRVAGPNFVSYQHGLIYGEKAADAAEYFNSKWQEAYATCPKDGRRAKMRAVANELKETTEQFFEVKIVVLSGYYY